MTERRFPVAGTDPPLTIPWEVALDAHKIYCIEYHNYDADGVPLSLETYATEGGFTESELDTWYGKHWREMAE